MANLVIAILIGFAFFAFIDMFQDDFEDGEL